jgi:predicted amidohydrolase
MSNFKIALLQMSPTGSMQGNLQKGLDFCHKAKSMDADLALFPEIWQLGYVQDHMNRNYAIQDSDEFVEQHISLAKQLKMAIAITYLKTSQSKPRNNLLVIDKDGNIVLEYAKVHICDFKNGTECNLSHGNKFNVATLNFATGSVPFS